MSKLTDLLRQVDRNDPQLAADLEREYKALSSRRAFGLNFERHHPESTEIPGRTVRKGEKVRVLPPRGSLKSGDKALWVVQHIERVDGGRVAHLIEHGTDSSETRIANVDDLVVVSVFRDFIYPGLISTGKVEQGGDKPFHTVINGENYHALKTLTYTHEGKIDVIYIDPPYNTGAKDWKYNNDYVEGDDLYRHSKWLAFMERRLLLVQKLLNPKDSVLIVTIDEKEYLRLGLLLEQTFPDGRITMVTSSINNAGVSRKGTFGRAAEYIFIVQFGMNEVQPLALGDEWNPVGRKSKHDVLWNPLIRTGTDTLRTDSPNQFYPIYVASTAEGPVFHSIGEAYFGGSPGEVSIPDGCYAIWPIRRDGQEGRWQVSAQSLRELITEGSARLGRWRGADTTVYYLKRGERKKVADGVFTVTGKRSDGSVITDASQYTATFIPTDVWRIMGHDAGHHGSSIIHALLPGRKFPFPKSLYAVEDALRFFVKDKPDATVLDFFAGSGTTAHAVMRLNRQDDGRRQCISVTNNEVAADEQKVLRKTGLRPGDSEWEQAGICDYITKPRLKAAVTGKTPQGDPVKGNYKFIDEFPMSEGMQENVQFFALTYETQAKVAYNKAFRQIAPLLWLRAGARGKCIEAIPDAGWALAEAYGVLIDLDISTPFIEAVKAASGIKMVYIITNDTRRSQAVAQRLPAGVEVIRLYESYLKNFQIKNGG